MDGVLLQLVGRSVQLALGWYTIPGRRNGPSGVGWQQPLTGRVASSLWPCWAEEAA